MFPDPGFHGGDDFLQSRQIEGAHGAAGEPLGTCRMDDSLQWQGNDIPP